MFRAKSAPAAKQSVVQQDILAGKSKEMKRRKNEDKSGIRKSEF